MSFMARMFNRRAKVNSKKILDSLNLKNKIIVDLGSGEGYYTLEFAKEAKKVYALDKNEKFLNFIKKQIDKNKIKNVETVKIKENPSIPEKVDFIFLRNVYHHLENRINYFRDLRKFLKQGSKIVVVEWNTGTHSTKKQTIIEELKKANYKLFKDINIPQQNFLIFEK